MIEKNQTRREFLGKALGAAILVVLNPLEVLSPEKLFAGGGNEPLNGTFVVDLTLSKYAALKNVNGSVRFATGGKPSVMIVLTRTSNTQFQAVNASCTHQGIIVNPYSAALGYIYCSGHTS